MSKRKFESSSEENIILGYIHVTNDAKKARNTEVMYFDGAIEISN